MFKHSILHVYRESWTRSLWCCFKHCKLYIENHVTIRMNDASCYTQRKKEALPGIAGLHKMPAFMQS